MIINESDEWDDRQLMLICLRPVDDFVDVLSTQQARGSKSQWQVLHAGDCDGHEWYGWFVEERAARRSPQNQVPDQQAIRSWRRQHGVAAGRFVGEARRRRPDIAQVWP